MPSSLPGSVPNGWQVQQPGRFGESVCRVWEGSGSMERCVLKSEVCELAIDVVEVRVIPQHYELGCRLPAHGTLTVDVRSDRAWVGLQKFAQSREAVVLQRPRGSALEMRLGLSTTQGTQPADGSRPQSVVTYSWHAP